ncbi:MAG TPA: carboxypeptidase-like regulatory domain-containing protein, partial [Gemmataceae bacterium]
MTLSIPRPGPAALMTALVLAAAGPIPQAFAAGPGVHGRVQTAPADGLRPVAGATVEFKDAAGKVAATATADAGGYYKADLPAGTYSYMVRADGFRTEQSGRGVVLRLSDGYAVYDFTLSPGSDPPGAVPAAPPATAIGKLRGQVYERREGGEPVGVNGAVVVLRRVKGGPPVQVLNRPPGDASRADSGYEVTLEAGGWRASVRADGYEPLPDDTPVEVEADKLAIRDLYL